MLKLCVTVVCGAFILQVGDVIVDFGPDLLTTCGNPANILSVNKTYRIGGKFQWAKVSRFSRFQTQPRKFRR